LKNDFVDLEKVKIMGLLNDIVESIFQTYSKSCLKSVKEDGLYLRHIDENKLYNREEVVLTAVSQNGLALGYVTDQSTLKNREQVVLAAVSQNGWALKYVKDQLTLKNREEVVLTAVKNCGWALGYVEAQHTLKNKSLVLNEALTYSLRHNQNRNELVHPESDVNLSHIDMNTRIVYNLKPAKPIS